MITVSKIASAGRALQYYSERDDYYREGGGAPAAFFGRGAEERGLTGAMASVWMARKFAATLATGDGTASRHTPGYDVTFSAPKSVSVAALVNGDDRLVAAHDAAVKAALAHIERHAVVTRQRDSERGYIWRHGDGMTAAVFRHTTSREQDPQLHSHSVIANATRDPATGLVRAIDSRELYRAQREAGAIYTTELAAGVRAAGYDVEFKISAEGHPTFELGDVPESVRAHFSTRSRQVEAALATERQTRETASSAAKQMAALDTRVDKEVVDHIMLANRWREEALDLGHNPYLLPATAMVDPVAQCRAAEAAVAQAAEHLGERDARFSARSLEHEAALFGQGKADGEHIREAIRELTQRGALEHRDVRVRAAGGRRELTAGFTTQAGIQTETTMLAAAQRLTDRHAYIGPALATQGHRELDAAVAIRRQEFRTGREFTAEQRAATTAILTEGRALHILHGYAGTAKTSSVLAAVQGAAAQQGFKIRALAPTHDAASKLGGAIGEKGATVASHVMSHSAKLVMHEPGQRELWIVDEAGMVSAKDMECLMQKADLEKAVVILAGDTRQLGSVEAGAAFEQLRDRFGSEDLTDIKRQKNNLLRESVYDAVRGDARAALSKVLVEELKTREQRVGAIVESYMARPAKDRAQTLILAPGKDDRQQINHAVRAARREAGELGRETTVTSLTQSDMTRAEQRDAARYQPGMVIEARRRFQRGPDKGKRGEVVGVEKGKVVVVLEGGHVWRFDPRKTAAIGVYECRRALRVAEGDQLIAKATIHADEGRGGKAVQIKNGTPLDVVRVRDDAIIVRDRHGTELAIGREAQVDYAYAQTVHQAQGQDYAHVIAHAESKRENLASLSALYVTISRARESAVVVSDSKDKLIEALERNTGRKATAMERLHDQLRTAPYPLGQLAEHERAQPQPASIDRAQPEPQVLQQPKQPPSPAPDQDRDDGPSWV